MINYEKRSPTILSCTDLAIESLILTSQTTCDASAGACMWMGIFTLKEFNVDDDDTLTYEWSTDIGAIQLPNDGKTVDIWVSASEPTYINITCTITCSLHGDTDTKTIEVLTGHII